MIAIKNILVGTDFGEASGAALAYGRAFARAFGGTLHVLHVVDDVSTRAATAAGFGVDFEQVQREMEDAARTDLNALLSDEDRRDLRAKAVVLTSTTPALSIVQYARDAQVDLIVIGTHGRGAVSHLFLGSVAERVVRMAPCPALTVRHPEREFVLPDALVAVKAS